MYLPFITQIQRCFRYPPYAEGTEWNYTYIPYQIIM